MASLSPINKKIKFGLFSRMLIALFALLVSTLTILSVSLLNNAANQFDNFRLQHVKSMAQTLAEGSLDALVTEDYELLERFVNSSLPSHYGAYTYLTRPNGQVLSSTDLDLVATKILPPKFTSSSISRTFIYKNRPIVEVVFKSQLGKKHIANAHIAYYTDQGNFSYFGQAKEIIIALVILLLVILAGTYIIVSRIRTPVLKLIDTVANTSHDSPIHLPPHMFKRNDEVGTLARSFDDVFTRLTSANRKVINAKNNLELQVQQRTKQLSDKNIELEVTQHRIKTIMDNAGDSIISINEKGQIESFNIAAQTLFGYTLKEIIGENVNILMPEPYHSEHDGYLKRYLETGTSKVINKAVREVTGKRKDNSEFPMELQLNNIDIHGDILFIGIVRDITLEKQAKENLLHSNEVLEEKVKERTLELNSINEELIHTRDAALEASNIKSEFLSTISHELRTPLHVISGYESLLDMSDLNTKQSKYCHKIHDGAQSLLEIINDILDFSAFESGELKITSEAFSVTDTIHEICDMFNQSVNQKGLELSCYVDKNIPDSIFTDPKRLRQIIVHLISNAIKFTDNGSITVNATLQAKKLDNAEQDDIPYLQINVIDTGIGIEEKEFKRIFTPFYQVDGSVTRLHGGTGLGLAMSYKIIRLMGGNILLESHSGQGTTFTIVLPLLVKESYSSYDKVTNLDPNQNDEATHYDFNKLNNEPDRKILLVEDDEINAELLTLLLNDIGFSPDVAENGKVFLEMVSKNHYDLVLMDCQMPVMNGYEATKQYRISEDSDKHIPIIAVTANTMPGDREKCLNSGMDDYIAKPVAPTILKTKISHWLMKIT